MYERSGNLIKEKFREYLLPTMLTSLAVSMASVVDGMIVGSLLGDTALATIGLAGPVIFCINLLYMLFGVGGLTCASIAQGRRDTKQADLIFTFTIIGGVTVMLLFTLAAQLTLMPLSRMLAGGDLTLAAMTEQYLRPLVFTGPAMMFASGVSLFIRMDGKPRISAVIVIIANGVNLVLDYILIRYTDRGIEGAGLSTTLGYVVSAVAVLPYLLSKKRSFHFTLPGKGSPKVLLTILKSGLPKAGMQICNILRSLILNAIIIRYLGSLGMSTMTICINVLMLFNIFSGGTADTIVPIVGILFGEKDYYGIRQAMKSARNMLIVSCTVLLAFFLLFPQLIAKAFGIEDLQTLETVSSALRLFALLLPFDAALQLLQSFYNTTGRRTLATTMVVMNGLVFVVLFAFVLVQFSPDLLWLSYACSAASSLGVALILCRRLGRKEKIPGILLIRKENERCIRYDISVTAEPEQAVGLANRILAIAEEKNVHTYMPAQLALAVEEMVRCTAHYAHSDSALGEIDIHACITLTQIVIRFRDSGKPFHPTQYIPDPDDHFCTEHLDRIKEVAKSIEYTRPLGYNNTVLTFDRPKEGAMPIPE